MKSYSQLCAVARALDLIGDRWSLLIVRELLISGQVRFTDLQYGLPGIAPNLLTQRLRQLTEDELVVRQVGPPPAGTGYRLTDRGRALEPVIRELLRWGAATVPEASATDEFQMHWLSLPARYLLRDRTPQAPPVVVRFGNCSEGFDATAGDGVLHIGPCSPEATPAVTVSGPGKSLVGLIQGTIPLPAAAAFGVRLQGDPAALERLLPERPVDVSAPAGGAGRG